MISLASLIQTVISLLLLGVLAASFTVLGILVVLVYARATHHPLDDELGAYLVRAESGIGLLRKVGLVLLVGGPRALFLYRLSCMLRPLRLTPLLFVLRELNKFLNQCEISPWAEFGRGLQIFHGQGIIVSKDVQVGDSAWLFPNVALGSSWGKLPVIGDNVVLFAGVRVFGGVRIGSNCIISSNVVVQQDVPEDSVVAMKVVTMARRRDGDVHKLAQGMMAD